MPGLVSIVDPLGVWRRAARLGGTLADRSMRAAVDGGAVDAVVDAAIRAGLFERIADEVLARGVVERIAERALAGPEIVRVIEGDVAERLVVRVVESRLVDAAVERVLAGDELWRLVDEIARSPSVTEAITHQGVGFADQVAEELGVRSRRVDDRLEGAARRLLRRRVTSAPP